MQVTAVLDGVLGANTYAYKCTEASGNETIFSTSMPENCSLLHCSRENAL